MRHILLVAAIFSLAMGGLAGAEERPNILFIYLDDLGWRDPGFMGSDFYETPHLDRLAAQGMVFTDAYAGAANCAPSRACLLSGQYSPRHQIFNVGTKPRGRAEYRRLLHIPGVSTLDAEIKTWADRLQAAGYKTGSFGKWHLSHDPRDYGFDVNIGGSHSGGPPRGYYPPHGKVPGLRDAPDGEYVTDRLSDEVIQFIRESSDGPWCAYLTHFAVHTPLQPKKELVEKYQAKPAGELHDHVTMATMIQAVDDGVGRIVASLDELNLLDSTVIIFSSDNGGYGPATDMRPLKGYKGTYYEGGIRVPLFIVWPGVVKAGSKSEVPVTAVDIYPTLCEVAGVRLPTDQHCDGQSLVPLLKGSVSSFEDRPIYWHFPAYLQSYPSVANEQRDPLFRTRPCSVIRVGHWKLHEYFEDGAIELYDLRSDIGETTNRSETDPERRDKLLSQLREWRDSIGAPVPNEANPKFEAAAEAAAVKRLTQQRLRE
ncbi:sulfatase [Stratiformator vulcanicus]|uniref:Arylsulfatase n=1 Tax=Stratiformator vulcanicus TaxID=2527980 RepID=A0A517QYX5_9PLAN|nr:sulfatase [Stratiformator vulcanicus]QDT36804.1 Arylsulfatase [Stratiformator vulcanicus]